MRIGIVHNFYQWRGGEDSVFEAECALLKRHGFDVFTYTAHNKEIVGLWDKVRVFFGAIWSWKHYRGVRAFLKSQKIEIMHVHNFFPLLSPSIFWAAYREKVPVVFTVHNYRLGCLNAQYFREHAVCTKCQGLPLKYPGVVYGCYRGSRLGSLATSLVFWLHRVAGTWNYRVDRYLALTEFGRSKLLAENLPAEKILIKPNFVFPQPDISTAHKNYFLFMGRHFEEKGIQHLIKAWGLVSHQVDLLILGEGPLTTTLQEIAQNDPRIKFLGHVSQQERDELRRNARAVIFPSVWFEGFPMVITETLAAGVPVLSSRLGAMESIIQDGVNGLMFRPADPKDLADKVNQVCASSDLLDRLRAGARATAASSYQAESNFAYLRKIYEDLISHQSLERNA